MSVLDLNNSRLLAAACCAPLALLGAFALACAENADAQPVAQPEFHAQVDLPPWSALVIGPARGKLEPCGCSGGQLGGIDRLSSMLSFAAPPDGHVALRIAAGGIVAMDAQHHDAWARAQMETLYQSFGMMGVQMVGLAESDLVLLNDLESMKLLLGNVPIVATNLKRVGEDSSLGEAAPFDVSFRSGAGPQFFSFLPEAAAGVTSVSIPDSEDWLDTEWKAISPTAALDELKAAGTFDPSIPSVALFEGTDAAAASLGKYLGEGSTVLRVNDEYEASHELHLTPGESAAAELGTRLRYVIRLDSRDTGLTYNLSTVTEDVPGDPMLASMRGLYRMMLEVYGARDAVADSKGKADLGGYVGSDACASCHADAYAIWQESLHHVAMETLADDLRDGSPATNDPNCVACHSVGFGFESGYGSTLLSEEKRWGVTDGFAGVGCESCHGPGGQHAQTASIDHIERSGEYTCLACHDSENDPSFHFGRKWPDIEHNNE